MKRIFYTLLISLLVFPNINAQSNKAAVKIINDLVTVIEKNGIETNFGMVVKEARTKNQHKINGTFIMQGNKFVINTEAMKVYFDGTTQWAYSPSINEVAISNPTEKELSETNPLALLQAYRSKSTIRFSRRNKDKSMHLIELIPTDKNSEVRNIIVKVEKSTNNPRYIQLTDKKGNISAISLVKFRKGIITDSKTFTFDASVYKDIEINDLR